MYRLIQFLKRYYIVFLFVILEAGAISYYAGSTGYTRATLLATANKATAGTHNMFASIGDYFRLRRENDLLLERLAATEEELTALKGASDDTVTEYPDQKFFYTSAKVISNSIARQNNYFVINRGMRHGVKENMAVLAANGSVAGYVSKCSDKYSVCVSVLNSDFKIGGQIKGSEYFGSVYWDGTDSREMTLINIPKYAPVSVGDSILSTHSLRFPPDTFIGTVAAVQESEDETTHMIKVRLGARMSSLSDVILVENYDYDELNALTEDAFSDPQKQITAR